MNNILNIILNKVMIFFAWLNRNALAGIEEELRELIKGALFIDEDRTQTLCKNYL